MSERRKTVLIVDDDEGMRDTLTAVLKKDYRVLRAATGENALQIVEKEDVDLMLLDVRLPGISGFEVGVGTTFTLGFQATKARPSQQAAV